MDFINAFLYATIFAYWLSCLLPHTVVKNNPAHWLERLGLFAMGAMLLATIILNHQIFWLFFGVLWVLFALLSFLGYIQWNVHWRIDASDTIQGFMFAWDLSVAICLLSKVTVLP